MYNSKRLRREVKNRTRLDFGPDSDGEYEFGLEEAASDTRSYEVPTDSSASIDSEPASESESEFEEEKEQNRYKKYQSRGIEEEVKGKTNARASRWIDFNLVEERSPKKRKPIKGRKLFAEGDSILGDLGDSKSRSSDSDDTHGFEPIRESDSNSHSSNISSRPLSPYAETVIEEQDFNGSRRCGSIATTVDLRDLSPHATSIASTMIVDPPTPNGIKYKRRRVEKNYVLNGDRQVKEETVYAPIQAQNADNASQVVPTPQRAGYLREDRLPSPAGGENSAIPNSPSDLGDKSIGGWVASVSTALNIRSR